MRKIILIVLLLLTGCQTSVPCPKDMGLPPGELCNVLTIPIKGHPFMEAMDLLAIRYREKALEQRRIDMLNSEQLRRDVEKNKGF